MCGSSSRDPDQRPGNRWSRLSRRATALGGVGVLALVALLAAALIPTLSGGGSGKSTTVAGVKRAAKPATAAPARKETAYSDYLHLGAVYGLLPGALDQAIDGVPHTLTSTDGLTGLHRIEQGLWTGAAPRSLVPFADRLQSGTVQLRKVLPKPEILPPDYATRAHEILEDAQPTP